MHIIDALIEMCIRSIKMSTSEGIYEVFYSSIGDSTDWSKGQKEWAWQWL